MKLDATRTNKFAASTIYIFPVSSGSGSSSPVLQIVYHMISHGCDVQDRLEDSARSLISTGLLNGITRSTSLYVPFPLHLGLRSINPLSQLITFRIGSLYNLGVALPVYDTVARRVDDEVLSKLRDALFAEQP